MNRRVYDRSTGELASAEQSRAEYESLGLDAGTPHELRDDGNPAHMPSPARPMDRPAETPAEEHVETLRKYGFQP